MTVGAIDMASRIFFGNAENHTHVNSTHKSTYISHTERRHCKVLDNHNLKRVPAEKQVSVWTAQAPCKLFVCVKNWKKNTNEDEVSIPPPRLVAPPPSIPLSLDFVPFAHRSTLSPSLIFNLSVRPLPRSPFTRHTPVYRSSGHVQAQSFNPAPAHFGVTMASMYQNLLL